MNKRIASRLLALFVAILLMTAMLSVAASAEALPNSDTWKGGVINVSLCAPDPFDPVDEALFRNVSVVAYRIINVHTGAVADSATGEPTTVFEPEELEYVWTDPALGHGDPRAIGSHRQTQDRFVDSDWAEPRTVMDDISRMTPDEVDAFYAKVAAVIAKGTKAPKHTAPVAEDGTAKLKDLPMGVYFITVSGGSSVYLPTVVAIIPELKGDNWEVTAEYTQEMKGSPIGLSKVITAPESGKTTAVAVGDVVSYEITAEIPEYPADATSAKYILTDTMPSQKVVRDSIVVMDETGEEMDVARYLKVQNNSFTLDLSGAAYFSVLAGRKQITVTYDAELTAPARLAVLNTNTAKLTYSNNPYNAGGSKELTDTCGVYTYGIHLTKMEDIVLFEEDDPNYVELDRTGLPAPLNDVKFQLQDPEGEVMTFSMKSGAYWPDPKGSSELLTGSVVKGEILIKGLKEGTYTLTETEAPYAYLPLDAAIEITIEDKLDHKDPVRPAAGRDGKPEGADENGNEIIYEDGIVELTVTNYRDPEMEEWFHPPLPRTGGPSTVIFTALGMLLMGGGAVLVYTGLRKKKA